MNLKEYFRLAGLFGKLNSQEKLGDDDFTTMPEGEKLRFFWESCKQEKIDASSIIEKTRLKIRKDAMRRRRNYFLITSTSIAASILICISTIYFLNQTINDDIDLQAIAEGMDSQIVDEVTLITAKKQLNLDEDAFIKYSKEGKVAVNSQVIKEEEEKVKDKQEYNQLLVPPGKRARIELSDGTRLIVNSQSKVVYPRCFKGDIRKIYAQGEVFLEVAHDKKHPFIVESEDFNLRVLGTKFNISNYKGNATNIVLVEGAVEVTDKNEKKAQLAPCDLLNIAGGAIAYQKKVDVAEYISWVDGIMLLNGNDLSQIIQKLSIYYGISIQCDPVVGSEKVYGKLDLKDDIDEVIECIQQTLPFTIEKSDTSIYLNK
ncbi:FecR family protein [Bacteroides acidifaciens]|uniref:FecR family protein n=1 Tax=Bacteroides acidifaciens TaxID=85831 RepID=UPI001589F8F2|nr:FecR domain-containing protein [Bacteroides acidifaciens]